LFGKGNKIIEVKLIFIIAPLVIAENQIWELVVFVLSAKGYKRNGAICTSFMLP
jgi:hypothetical protein